MALVSDIISAVITELSQVAGLSTQVYAAPRIQQHIEDASKLLIDEMWWPNLMQFYQVMPDGVSGVMTADLVSSLNNHKVTRFQDIEKVWQSTSNRALRILPPGLNPYTLTGTNSQYITPNTTYALRPFSVWPITAADSLVVKARAYPVFPTSTTDTVYLDDLSLIYLAAFMFSADDGTNPGAIEKFKGMFEKRLTQAKAAWQQQSVQLDPRRYFPNDSGWTDSLHMGDDFSGDFYS